MTALDEQGHALRCAAGTGSGPCMREVAFRIERQFDPTDYACTGHLAHVVKARLRGTPRVTVERVRP